MSTFDELIADLTRDVYRARPPDTLQYCGDWFQKRLVEQRNLMRGALIQASSTTHRDSFMGISRDAFQDRPLHSQPDLVSPFSTVPQSRSALRNSTVHRDSVQFAPSPFGALNGPGNAFFPQPPQFRVDGAPTFSNPFGGPPPPPATDYLAPSSAIYDRRQSVSAESIDLSGTGPRGEWIPPVYAKTQDQLNRIKASIKDNLIFRNLDEGQAASVLDAMQEEKLPQDAVIIKQGETGATFYVVESGMFHCYIRPEPFPEDWLEDDQRQVTTLADGETPGPDADHVKFGKKVAECGSGQSFGELALMHGHARAATVLAMEPSTVWTLDRTTFRTIILTAADQRRKMFEKFLESVPLLVTLSSGERSKIADALISRSYEDGENVVTQGELGETFYFVDEGEAVVTKEVAGEDGVVQATEVGRLHHGDYFGELSLLRKEPRAATVTGYERTDPSQPRLKVAALDAGAFTRLLGPLRDLMERKAERYSIHR